FHVTGVQTCALPIGCASGNEQGQEREHGQADGQAHEVADAHAALVFHKAREVTVIDHDSRKVRHHSAYNRTKSHQGTTLVSALAGKNLTHFIEQAAARLVP